MKLSPAKIAKILILGLALCGLTSCGGGGGGGSTGAADARINVQPSSIDTGDRVKVTITLGELHENGISLKVKFPTNLTFVESSAEIQDDDGEEFGIVPDVNVIDSDTNYLVFYLTEEDFGESGRGDLVFELLGRTKADDALIEIDPDVDDPLVDNNIEFNVSDPLFDAEDAVYVNIKG